jgi:dihydroorotase-like cyclic amidohydrolase
MFVADAGIVGDKIAAAGLGLRGRRSIDAHGLPVMPGGVDSHCPIEQLQAGGGATGTIAPGADAGPELRDTNKTVPITNILLRNTTDYTPYEGLEVTGWPVSTIRRDEVAMQDGVVQAEPGTGEFLARAPYDLITPAGNPPSGFKF